MPHSAHAVVGVRTTTPVPVYNLMVADGYLPEFYANGILVHNCTWVPEDTPTKSPDRVDAAVHLHAYFTKRFGRSPTAVGSPFKGRALTRPANRGR